MDFILLFIVVIAILKINTITAFFLYFPVFYIQTKKKSLNCIIKNNHKENEYNVSSLNKKDGVKQKIKDYIYIYLDGYIRFISIKIGFIPSMRIRLFLYRHLLRADIGEKAIIYYGAEIRDAEKLKIGEGSIIGDKAILDARYCIEIGDNVNLSTGVWIWTAQHDYNSPTFNSGNKCGKVVIGNRAWLGPRTIIMPGVTVGEGAVVAGGAVVTKNVEPFTLVGGVPAKKIGDRNKALIYEFDGSHIPFY